jgi:membrane-associated protease RseP (regulator of RpoE activity)
MWFHVEVGGRRVDIYRRIPILMALDIDDAALMAAGFWRRCIFGLAGPLVNFLGALLVAWIFLGWRDGTGTTWHLIVDTARAIGVFFLAPLGVGSSAEFFSGPLQARLATAAQLGLPAVAGWWMLLNVLVGVANLFPLPALDGGVVLLSLLMAVAGARERAASVFRNWYRLAPHVASALPWAFLVMTVFHVVSFFAH